MRLITNEELLAVAGGDLEPDDIQSVEIKREKMTDDEKRDYDKREIWGANGSGGGV